MRDMVRVFSISLVVAFFCTGSSLAKTVKNCELKNNCIERTEYDPNPAVVCVKAIKKSAEAVKSFCSPSGGVSTTMPNDCVPEDVSYAWNGKPMFKGVSQVGVLCKGKGK